MSKNVPRLLSMLVVTVTIASISVGQVEKQSEGQRTKRPNKENEIDGSDLFAKIIEDEIKKLVKEFEMKDDREVAFFFSGFDCMKDLRLAGRRRRFFGHSQKGDADVLSKAYEKRRSMIDGSFDSGA